MSWDKIQSFTVGTCLPENKIHNHRHSEYLKAREGSELEAECYINFMEIWRGVEDCSWRNISNTITNFRFVKVRKLFDQLSYLSRNAQYLNVSLKYISSLSFCVTCELCGASQRIHWNSFSSFSWHTFRSVHKTLISRLEICNFYWKSSLLKFTFSTSSSARGWK